ncbi:MAG: hypothetical protein IPO21_04355 [Bacteroidales bacterium]|nr:hypothetical protein [Bacteroidales bacterium]
MSGCSNQSVLTVEIYALPTVTFSMTNPVVCIEQSGIQLSTKVSASKQPSTSQRAKVFSGTGVVDQTPLDYVFQPRTAG